MLARKLVIVSVTIDLKDMLVSRSLISLSFRCPEKQALSNG